MPSSEKFGLVWVDPRLAWKSTSCRGFPPVGGLIQRVHIDRFTLLRAKNGARNLSYREMTIDSGGLVPVR